MKYEEIQVHNTCSLPLCNQSLQVQELQGLKEAYQLPAHNTSYKKKIKKKMLSALQNV